MRLLWLCNMMPGVIREKITGDAADGALWVDHVLSGLRSQGVTIRVLCPGDGVQGQLDENCGFATFHRDQPHIYLKEQEAFFAAQLRDFAPEVVHVWGTEYSHTLAMVCSAKALGLLPKLVVSIQGLCSVYTGHYAEGVPYAIQRGYTFRDLVRRDNILGQQEKFRLRGQLEVRALQEVQHVIGRTHWDRACTAQINPDAGYHFCNETLREPFYRDAWSYEACQKHRIFASSCAYPVKGFHYLLEAFREVLRDYPDATLAVPGSSFLTASPLRRTRYQKYLADLARNWGMADKITFLGGLSAQGMKAQYLQANVFVLPSTIENSPNSLGEAMLLGTPSVASDVGGVVDLMTREEGCIYPSTAPYMLAHHVKQIFAMEDRAEEMGRRAHAHAAATHDPDTNLKRLLEIYREVTGEGQ